MQLDGRASTDPDSDSLTYAWRQTGGPAVTLSTASSATPTFVAPTNISADEEVVFELVVNDRLLDSAPSTVALTIKAAAPWGADGFASTMAAAVAAGQFTFNNPWTQGDLNYENIDATIGYDNVRNANAAGRVDSFTTLVSQYQARRSQCEADYQKRYPRSSWTNPLTSWTYHFTDHVCYPTLRTAGGMDNTTDGDPAAQQVLQRYGYYCGAGYPDYGAFNAGSPEPLDGVDYCCRLHDAGAWNGRGDYSNECGILMCLAKVTAMPSTLWAELGDVEEARQHWYGQGAFGGASFLCPGNQSDDAGPPILGP